MSIEQRFWAKVKRGGQLECWEWTAHLNKGGYGRFRLSLRDGCTLAHRVSYELAYGAFPKEKLVLHKCDNPRCVNPEHLFLGTSRDNTHDMVKKGRNKPAKLPGERNPSAKLTADQVRDIRSSREHYSVLMKRYSVSNCTIFSVRRGATYKNIGPKP